MARLGRGQPRAIFTASRRIAAATSPAYLSGTVNVTSTVTGALSARTYLFGTVNAVSTVVGQTTVPQRLTGLVSVVSSVSGSLTISQFLTGTVTITSTVSGSLTAPSQLSGTVIVVSGVSGTVTTTAPLSGTVGIVSSVSGQLGVPAQLSGLVAIVSTVTGTLSILIEAVGHEPGWIYATPAGILQADEVTQFLKVHDVQVVAQGSPVVEVTGELTTWQALGEVDQPFVAPANVGWFRIPVTSTDLDPTTQAGWPTPAPMTVSIYTDSSGVPGSLVASTLVPAEQIGAVQSATWPEPDDLLFGPAVTDTQASLPQLPGSGWTGITSLVAGAWALMFATQSPSNTQMWVASFDGSELGGWSSGPTLPVSGIDQVVFSPTSQVIVILSGGLMWAATFSQNGVVGSWQSLPSLSLMSGGFIGILTYQGSDYLVAVATDRSTSYASVLISAGISAWTAGQLFPVSFSAASTYQVDTDLVAIVQSSGVSTLVSLSAPSNGWMVSGTLTASSNQVLGIIGSSIITTNGTAIDATALTALGTALWSLPIPLSAVGANVTLLAFFNGTGYTAFWIPTTSGVSGWQQIVYTPSWVSVPLPQALSSGSTYHLVMSGSNTLVVGTAVPVVTPASGPTGLIFNGTSWVALGGAVPFIAFYAASGPPLALIGIGKTTLTWFDTPTGAMTSVVELVGGTSNSRSMTYADGVLTEVV